ncbi:MAG TPA: hypothetical protein PLP37_08490 [Clostridiales bacterium]|jgi:hypothetical protein|nr:hypothetical protein [Clostridiales bacterium]
MKEYKETQKFNSPLVWFIVGIAVIGGIVALYFPAGQKEELTLIPKLFIISALITLILMFLYGYLKTSIDESGIKIEMRMLFRFGRNILWDDIQSIKVDKYRPILEFGGWGYRIGWKGVAYNCSGNDGLIIILKNGRKVVVGTQKPDELKKFLVENGKN